MDKRIETLQKYNIWSGTPFKCGLKRREYTDKIMDYVGNRLIKVLTGQRRTGKSYLLRQILMSLVEQGVPANNTLYINRELTDFDYLLTYQDLVDLVKVYREEMRPVGKTYLFVDEIQLIEGWEKAVNSYSQNFTVEMELFICGSNSKLLSGELASLLSGRYVEFQVFPFSFAEYVEISGKSSDRTGFMEYMETGGLPELYALPDKREVRQNYVESVKDSILLRDIVKRHQIRDPKLLEDIFAFLINNASNLISLNGIVKYFKGKNRKTSYDVVSAYIGYLEESFLFHRCERFDIRGKEIMSGTCKMYANDLAYRNFLFPGFAYGIGYELENLMYLTLRRAGYAVYTGSDMGTEVDFVAKKDDRLVYVQCAYTIGDEQTAAREYAPLESVRDSYEKYVVTLDDFTLPSHLGIRHAHAWEFKG